jgi:hypothetical protein
VSLDTRALFSLDERFLGLPWLRDELAKEPPAIRAVVDEYRHRWQPQEWAVGPGGDLLGPGGFSIRVGQRGLSLWHLLRFSTFAGEKRERDLLRRACLVIANLVHSPKAIFMHELLPDGFYEGLDFAGCEATLRAEFGAPACTFEELLAAGDWGRGCWYLDDFADLRSTT